MIPTKIKNQVIRSMITILNKDRQQLIEANQKDLAANSNLERALRDRLIINDAKVDDMIRALTEIEKQNDPVNQIISEVKLENGLQVVNKTAPFGTIMIIYESRPDVTIEAAVLAFKAGNRILLKGGKEALHSNLELVRCWHEALASCDLDKSWVTYLNLDRNATQEFLKNPLQKIDLIVPRGGERLIDFVKTHATCAVLVSGRGNNFIYVAPDADWKKVTAILLNAKTHKISACNALDKILIDQATPDLENCIKELYELFKNTEVEVLGDGAVHAMIPDVVLISDEEIWYEEFLAMKCCMGIVNDQIDAIHRINKYSGGHSNGIITESAERAAQFMSEVDSTTVYHNASTRFTDGGQMGVGAELAISTDKLHHRGPLGLQQLVSNKYYVHGNGQVRD